MDLPQLHRELERHLLVPPLAGDAIDDLRDQLCGQCLSGLQQGPEARNVRVRLLEAERRPEEAVGHPAVRGGDGSAEQQRVGADVGADLLLQHLHEHCHGPLHLPLRDARLQQVVVDMNVEPEAVRPRQLLAQLEGNAELLAAVGQLHQNGQREVARLHAIGLHLLEDLHALLVEVLTGAAVQEGVVGLLVGPHVPGLLHRVEELPRLLQLVVLAVALQHRAVGHQVWLDPLLEHLVEQGGRPADLAAP
mmetsp:Transcript_108344/g.288305  ORF Transcript_108344/g.288305 Transcript_108344/m.288305 type:complete len:249 (+) Transcript_108344:163-909(+)